ARLRATDEQVALAKSGLRPFISASGDVGFEHTDNDISNPSVAQCRKDNPSFTRDQCVQIGVAAVSGFPAGTSNPRGWSVQLTQPLFEGFQNLNAIRQAKSHVHATRERARSVVRQAPRGART